MLRRISSKHLRHARPFFAADWSPRDVPHAIDHEPGGRQHGYTSGVRSPAGWIRSRLAAWSGPNGIPLPSRSQRLAARSSPARPPAAPGGRRRPGQGRRLRRFEALTSALWTVQHAICAPARRRPQPPHLAAPAP